jgi:hypothetical protein
VIAARVADLGARFGNRQLVFFAIILPLALLTFWLLQRFGPPAGS